AWVGKSMVLENVNRTAHQVSAAMFADGIRHSLELPYLEFEQRRSGETVDRLQRLRTTVEKFIVSGVNIAFTSSVRILMVIIYATAVYWPIGLYLALVTPMLGAGSIMLSRKTKQVEQQLVEQN